MANENGSATIPDVIQAKAFQVVDDNGNVRAMLQMTDGGDPYFALLDEDGRHQLAAGLHGKEGFLTLLNEDGYAGASIDFNESGNTTLALHDRLGEPRLVAELNESDEPALNLIDQDGEARLVVDLEESGAPTLRLSDQDGTDRLVARVFRSGHPVLLLSDSGGGDRLAAGVSRDGPVLIMKDQNRKHRLSATVSESGQPQLSLCDETGQGRISATVSESGDPDLALLSQDEQAVISAWVGKSGTAGFAMNSPRESLIASTSGPYSVGIPSLSLTGPKGEVGLGQDFGAPHRIGFYVHGETQGAPSSASRNKKRLAATIGSTGPSLSLENDDRVTDVMAHKIDKYRM